MMSVLAHLPRNRPVRPADALDLPPEMVAGTRPIAAQSATRAGAPPGRAGVDAVPMNAMRSYL
ncbi:MAG: hypothetical protein DLM62_13060 [Pseudonocardiales bacterium]|nr:MAG: hypothetical protein DLM62_13060 [Pseudonocardiales bacterium]